MAEIDVTEPKMVKVYYCICGQSIQKVSTLKHAETDRAARKEFKQALEWERKVEVMTLEQFHETSFMCEGIVDCPKPINYPPRRKKKDNETTDTNWD